MTKSTNFRLITATLRSERLFLTEKTFRPHESPAINIETPQKVTTYEMKLYF